MQVCTHTSMYTDTQTHTSALVLPTVMHQAFKSHSFKSALPGWTFPLYQDIAETASTPQTAEPLHLSHRALQELQVNLLQSWIRATASVAVRPEIQNLFWHAQGSSCLKTLVLTISWHLPRAGGSLPEGRRHRPMPLGLGHSPPGQARESQADGARRKHHQVVGQLRM